MNRILHVEYFARVAREAASSLKAHSAVWLCGHPFRPPAFDRQAGKGDRNAFHCTERSFSVMVRLVSEFTSAGFSQSPSTWRPVASDSAGSVKGPRQKVNMTSAREVRITWKSGSGSACALRCYWTPSLSDVIFVWLFATVSSSGLTSTYGYR